MTDFAVVQLCHGSRRATCSRDPPKPAVLLSKHDLVRTAPTDAVDEVDLAEFEHGPTIQRDLLQRAVRVEPERLPIRREERTRGAFGPRNMRSFELVEAAQVQLDVTLTFSAEDERAAIRRKCYRRSARPTLARRCVQSESAQQAFSRPHANQNARDWNVSRLGAHRHPHDERRDGGNGCRANGPRNNSPRARTVGFDGAGIYSG